MVLVFCTSAAIGIYLSNSLSKRVQELDCFLALIEKMETHIRFYQTPTGQMLDQIASNEQFDDLPFLALCAEKIKVTNDFPIAWRSSVRQAADRMHLVKGDIELINTLADTLGSSDVEGQLGSLELLRQLIQQNHEQAFTKQKSHSRMYRSLGVLAGLAFVVMIA